MDLNWDDAKIWQEKANQNKETDDEPQMKVAFFY